MKAFKYIVYKEGNYYVSQCLNVDVSSFGSNVQEAIDSLKEAVQLYFDDNQEIDNFTIIHETLIGEAFING